MAKKKLNTDVNAQNAAVLAEICTDPLQRSTLA